MEKEFYLRGQLTELLEVTITILSNSLTSDILFEQLMNKNVLRCIEEAYFRLPRGAVMESCEYFYLNLLVKIMQLVF